MESNLDTFYGSEFVDWEQCGPAEGESDEGIFTNDPTDFAKGHTIEGPATGPIGATDNNGTVVQPEGITPYLFLRRDESIEPDITMQEPAARVDDQLNDETTPLGTGNHDSPSYDQELPTQSSSQCGREEPDPIELKDAKGVEYAIDPHVEMRRVQPGRKAKKDTRDRILKDKTKSGLSVNEGTPLIKSNKLPRGRVTRSSCDTKTNAGTAVPEFIQGSSRSPLTGAVGIAGPSSRAGTVEGLGLKKPALPTRHHNDSVRQGYIAIWGPHNKEDKTKEIPKTNRGYVFGGSPLFDLWVEGLESEGFPKENLKNISKGKSCQLENLKVDGKGACGWKNKYSKSDRHIYRHLRNKPAFWFHCPACGKHTTGDRKDTLGRHAKSCAKASGIPSTELLKDLEKNEFLHLPLTPALVTLAEKQRNERNPPTEGPWFPDETELYIKTVKARVANANQVPAKRKRKDDESSAQPSKKSKKRKGGS